MTKQEIVQWIKNEFGVLRGSLTTPDDVIEQCIDNAIRYWNTHSGFKVTRMYQYQMETKRIQVDPEIKMVVKVIPNMTTTWVFQDLPLWTLLGTALLDNVTSDLILMGEAFRTYKKYLGAEFAWVFEKSDDPSQGGYLYVIGMPPNATKVCVVGTKRIVPGENIVNQYILDWILSYSKALVKMVEGNALRKAEIIGAKSDGQALYDEGKDEKKYLEDQLVQEGRWVALVKRI